MSYQTDSDSEERDGKGFQVYMAILCVICCAFGIGLFKKQLNDYRATNNLATRVVQIADADRDGVLQREELTDLIEELDAQRPTDRVIYVDRINMRIVISAPRATLEEYIENHE